MLGLQKMVRNPVGLMCVGAVVSTAIWAARSCLTRSPSLDPTAEKVLSFVCNTSAIENAASSWLQQPDVAGIEYEVKVFCIATKRYFENDCSQEIEVCVETVAHVFSDVIKNVNKRFERLAKVVAWWKMIQTSDNVDRCTKVEGLVDLGSAWDAYFANLQTRYRHLI